MESRIGWFRAVYAAQSHDVTVLCGPGANLSDLSAKAAELGLASRLRFVPIPHTKLSQWLFAHPVLFYHGYELWQRAVFDVAQALHQKQPFQLVHQVNYCGYRQPGYVWKLGVPFVWGPVGGTQGFPWRYLSQADVVGGVREAVRNVLNSYQLRYCPKVKQAGRAAAAIFAATRTAQQDLRRCLEVECPVELETALHIPNGPSRELRDPAAPLKILWAGRLKTWKGLPLLLRALAQIPPAVKYQLRVLGEGTSEKTWRRLAQKLGIADRLEWVGWPTYRETLPHYQWADVFAFTSLRDTSGTGLLEALAYGAPIIGLNHQGAADVMTAASAMPIPVSTPRATITAFARAIEELATDSPKLLSLSRAAQQRAELFAWERTGQRVAEVYDQVLGARGTEPALRSARRALELVT